MVSKHSYNTDAITQKATTRAAAAIITAETLARITAGWSSLSQLFPIIRMQ
jgi:hypothetical protein